MAEIASEDMNQLRDLLERASWSSGEEINRIAKAQVNVHLTHQQRLARLLHAMILAIHEFPYKDGRNEAAKGWAAKVIEASDGVCFPLI